MESYQEHERGCDLRGKPNLLHPEAETTHKLAATQTSSCSIASSSTARACDHKSMKDGRVRIHEWIRTVEIGGSYGRRCPPMAAAPSGADSEGKFGSQEEGRGGRRSSRGVGRWRSPCGLGRRHIGGKPPGVGPVGEGSRRGEAAWRRRGKPDGRLRGRVDGARDEA